MAPIAPRGPLVSAEWLGEQLHDDEIRVVDCRFYLAEPERGHREYLEAHIPGALYLSLDDDLTGQTGPGRHALPDPADFAATLRTAGIGNQHAVVVYDQHDSSTAARLWWMLRSLGHESVYVLDGGWAAWTAEPRSTTEEIPGWPPADLELAADWEGTVERDGIDTSVMTLVDARAPERHRGEIEPIDPIAGHIPGSINIPYHDNTDDAGRFLDSESLLQRFTDITTADRIVVYCGSGVTACNNILAMAIAGLDKAELYPGSWSGWIEP